MLSDTRFVPFVSTLDVGGTDPIGANTAHECPGSRNTQSLQSRGCPGWLGNATPEVVRNNNARRNVLFMNVPLEESAK